MSNMSTSEYRLRSTPRLFDDDRELYEKAYREGNILVQASISLDTQIQELKNKIYREEDGRINLYTPAPEEIHVDTDILFHQAMIALGKSKENNVGSWNDYFRLALQAEMIHERLLADLLFMAYDGFDRRREFFNGVAGKNISIVDLILTVIDKRYGKHFDRQALSSNALLNESFERERSQLRGALSEATTMALANYSQSPSKLALPARTYGDLYQKTDMVYYYTDDKTKQSYVVPAQIKTSRSSSYQQDTSPEYGFTLYMSDYDDSRNFRLARLLVAQHEPRNLSEDDQHYLESARARFDADIKQLRTEHPGVPLHKIIE